jgi:thymidine kinase
MSVKLIVGPMFSGKTTKILEISNEGPCDVIVPMFDTRYGEKGIFTHDGKYSSSCIRLNSLADYEPTGKQKIVIDETHFFQDVKEFILTHIGLDLVFVGLISDWQGKIFPSIAQVFPFATEIRVLTGMCGCGGRTQLTRRLTSTKDLFSLGGSESYEPVCVNCFIDPN